LDSLQGSDDRQGSAPVAPPPGDAYRIAAAAAGAETRASIEIVATAIPTRRARIWIVA
jgi:hypothetical protein